MGVSIGMAVAAPIISSVVQGAFGGGSKGGMQQAAGAADPFAGQRPQYQEQLSKMMSDPSSFTTSGAGKFAAEQGMQSLDASMAAKGLGVSGAERTALTGYATGIAGQQYQQQLSNLMTLSGATGGSPGTAGQLMGQQATSDAQSRAAFGNLVGQAVTQSPTFQSWGQPAQATPTDMSGFSTPYQAPAYDTSMQPDYTLLGATW